MSDRITSSWTPGTEGAFGDTPEVRKGNRAEVIYLEYAKRVYDRAERYESDEKHQIAGNDIAIRRNTWSRDFYVDAKGNLKPDGQFYVDTRTNGWIRNPNKNSDRICHICEDSGWAVEYDRREMQKYLDHNRITGEYKWLSVFDKNIQHLIKRFKIV